MQQYSYLIERSQELDDLMQRVNIRLENGWRTAGGLCIHTTWRHVLIDGPASPQYLFCQALVKVHPE